MSALRAIRREIATLLRESPIGEFISPPVCDCEHCRANHEGAVR